MPLPAVDQAAARRPPPASPDEPEIIVVAHGATPPHPPTPAASPADGASWSFAQWLPSATIFVRSQYKVQLAFLRRAGAMGDVRALTLGGALVTSACALIGLVGHALTLDLAGALLSLALLPTALTIALIEAEGHTAAELSLAVLERLPLLRRAHGRAALLAFAVWLSTSAGPVTLALLSSPLLVSAAAYTYADVASQPPLAKLAAELDEAAIDALPVAREVHDEVVVVEGGAGDLANSPVDDLVAVLPPGERARGEG